MSGMLAGCTTSAASGSGRNGRTAQPRVVALGQAGVDFVAADGADHIRLATTFSKAAGGTPANVAVGLAKLGVPVAFVGKLADDELGCFLVDTLGVYGVDVRGVVMERGTNTTVGFSAPASQPIVFGDDGPENRLRWREVRQSLFAACRIFHFGSLTLRLEPARTTTWRALALARRAGALISFDPNFRTTLWRREREKDAIRLIRRAAALSDVVKLSGEELELVAPGRAGPEAFRRGFMASRPSLLVVTRGAEGCEYCGPGFHGSVQGLRVASVDMTGAGDAFVAGLLFGILGELDRDTGFGDLLHRPEAVRRIAEFANAAGAVSTTVLGGMPSLPHERQVLELMERREDSR